MSTFALEDHVEGMTAFAEKGNQIGKINNIKNQYLFELVHLKNVILHLHYE